MANPFARIASSLFGGGRQAHFAGASHSRLWYDWVVSTYHPDRETQWSLGELRARARDLVRNNPYAAGIVEAFADNIIGAEGIRAKADVRDAQDNRLRRVNATIESAWADWGVCENASADGMGSWIEIQRLLAKTWAMDGEVFLRERAGFRNPHGYALEFIDADLLDETYNIPPNEDGVEIRQGIELDRDGRRLAYHFWERHPHDLFARGSRVRVSADQIIHWFVRYRPNQVRGFSLFAPVLTTVKMIDGLTEAELIASRMAAAKMGFITNNEPDAVAAYADRLRAQNDADEAGDGQSQEAQARRMDIAPGVLDELLPGQGFEGFDPTHPNAAFEHFLKVMLRGVARGFSISYLTLTGDVSDANYSSMRAGLLPERDHWSAIQVVMTGRVHRRVYHGWMAMALLSGALALPGPPSAYRRHLWRPRGWKWVDPFKDLLAAELGIALGVNSRSRVAGDQGLDYEQVVDEIADEEAYAEAAGVDVSGLKRDPEDPDDEDGGQNGRAAIRHSRVRKIMEEASFNGTH